MLEQKISLAVVMNEQGEILLSQRKKGLHLEGLWEFPGGKVNSGESFKQALRRELREELNVSLNRCRRLIDFSYCYPDRELHFQVFIVLIDESITRHAEQQNIRWIKKSQLDTLALPEANDVICNALLMPDLIMIADQKVLGDDIITLVEKQLKSDVRIVQYRADANSTSEKIVTVGRQLKSLCDQYSATLVLNSNWQLWEQIQPHGVHIKSCDLQSLKDIQGELPFKVISAACHSEQDADLINQLAIDSVIIGSVLPTLTHPQQASLGWIEFSRLCQKINKPVFAIGGCKPTDRDTSQVYGGHGIATIRGFLGKQYT